MSKRVETEHPEVRALEDLAWSIKDLAADFYPRAMSAPMRATVTGATRDLQRIYDRLHAELHKRKRSTEQPDDAREPVPLSLLEQGGGGHG